MEKLNLNQYEEIEKYFSKYSLNAEIFGIGGKIHELRIDGEVKPFKVIQDVCKAVGCERYLGYSQIAIEENEPTIAEEPKEIKPVVEEEKVVTPKPNKKRRR